MGTTTTLTAEDGHKFAAYQAVPDGPVKGRLVVVQEAFGLNSHIRDGLAVFAHLVHQVNV